MDEHRKMAEELHLEYLKDCSGFVDIVSNAFRITASKSEKDGWNKAVEECDDLVMKANDGYDSNLSRSIRRLIREDAK